MSDLTPNQKRLLRELDFQKSKRTYHWPFALTMREVRYKITQAGRAVLSS